MNRARPATLLPLLLLTSTLTLAPCLQGQALATTPTVQESPRTAKRTHALFGAMLDVGVPDFIGTSLVVTPLRWLQLHAGVSTDLAALGLRGGVTFLPFSTVVAPSLTIEGGHVFEGNANALMKKFGIESPVFDRIGYSYANAHLGLEIGSNTSVRFFIHGGVSYLRTTVHNLQQVMQEEVGDPTITFADPKVTGFIPSAKLGLVVFL